MKFVYVAGLRYARMLAIYQSFIDLNCVELKVSSVERKQIH